MTHIIPVYRAKIPDRSDKNAFCWHCGGLYTAWVCWWSHCVACSPCLLALICWCTPESWEHSLMVNALKMAKLLMTKLALMGMSSFVFNQMSLSLIPSCDSQLWDTLKAAGYFFFFLRHLIRPSSCFSGIYINTWKKTELNQAISWGHNVKKKRLPVNKHVYIVQLKGLCKVLVSTQTCDVSSIYCEYQCMLIYSTFIKCFFFFCCIY